MKLLQNSITLSPCCKPCFSADPPGTVHTMYANSLPSAPVLPPTTRIPKPRAALHSIELLQQQHTANSSGSSSNSNRQQATISIASNSHEQQTDNLIRFYCCLAFIQLLPLVILFGKCIKFSCCCWPRNIHIGCAEFKVHKIEIIEKE